jgi:hypothetical protein
LLLFVVIRKRRGVYRVLVGRPGADNLEYGGAYGRIILKWIFKKWHEICELD